jgi:integrase
MASFQKISRQVGAAWRAQISIKGVRDSGIFSTKAEAQAWAAERETAIRKGKAHPDDGHTVDAAFRRYEKEVSAHKRGKRWEIIRLNALAAHLIKGRAFGTLRLIDVTPAVLGAWRDSRMTGPRAVSGSTVNRDLNLLSHVFTTARREWGWVVENPCSNVRRPKNAPPRERRISEEEIERITLALGFDEGAVCTPGQAVAVAFLFAIETAMRAGEICGLRARDISGPVAHLPITKNGRKRDVPLSARARDLLSLLPNDGPTLFGLTTRTLDTLFRKAKQHAMIEGLTFHDTRHEAITRLASKLSVLELARMVGHTNLNELQTYYNESAANLARKL